MKGESDHTAFYCALGKNIRDRRNVVGFSQDFLAQLVGLTRTSLTNIEKGRQRPPLHTLCEIAEQLQTDPSNLLPSRAGIQEPRGIDVEAIATQQTRNPDELAFITSVLGRKK